MDAEAIEKLSMDIKGLKGKVTMTAIASGILGILGAGFVAYSQYEVSHTLIGRVQEEFPDNEQIQQIPDASPDYNTLMFSVFMGLLVPALAYFGASKENPNTVTMFTVCTGVNSLSICSNCCRLVFFLGTLGLLVPIMTLELELCDFSVHCPLDDTIEPNEYGLVKDDHAIDCMAKGMWQTHYTRRYPNQGNLMDPSCVAFIPLGLNCTYEQPTNGPLDVQAQLGARATALTSLVHPQTHAYQYFTPELGSGLTSLSAYVGVGHASEPLRLQSDPFGLILQPAPEDPIASCWANSNGYSAMHFVTTLVPEVWSSASTFGDTAVVLQSLSLLVGVVSLWWGCQLQSSLSFKQRNVMQPLLA